MPATKSETAGTWDGGAASKTISVNTRVDCDAFLYDPADVAAAVQISFDNQNGSPSSGDWIDVYIKYTSGDLLGDSGDDYDTDEHAKYPIRADTYGANTPGEDPVRLTIPLNPCAKGVKISLLCNQGNLRSILVRHRFVTIRA